MFDGFPATQLRLVIRVNILCTQASGLIGPFILLTYNEKLNVCSYTIHLRSLKLQ